MKTQNHSVFGVILAGGSGTRFWPRSRQSSPKQLCKITDPERTMLEQTLSRLNSFIPASRRMIVTHQAQEKKTRTLTAQLCKHLLAEPAAKNTAAALALAVLQIKLIDANENTVMISLHSDHLVKDTSAFQKTLQSAVDVASKGYLTLVGIVPRSPETGFGYIQKAEPVEGNAFKVKSFKEKPNESLAREYLATKQYFWNSGIFVWQIKTICAEFEKHLPQIWQPLYEVYKELQKEKKTFEDLPKDRLEKIYASLPEISIDDGILEKSSLCAVLPASFDWNDVGSWPALQDVFAPDSSGNIQEGDVLLLKTQNCIVASDGFFVATYGVQDLIVVVENGCVLVCPKDKAQGIKDIVAKLKEKGRNELI